MCRQVIKRDDTSTHFSTLSVLNFYFLFKVNIHWSVTHQPWKTISSVFVHLHMWKKVSCRKFFRQYGPRNCNSLRTTISFYTCPLKNNNITTICSVSPLINFYSATTWTGPLRTKLTNQSVNWEQRMAPFFVNGPMKLKNENNGLITKI